MALFSFKKDNTVPKQQYDELKCSLENDLYNKENQISLLNSKIDENLLVIERLQKENACLSESVEVEKRRYSLVESQLSDLEKSKSDLAKLIDSYETEICNLKNKLKNKTSSKKEAPVVYKNNNILKHTIKKIGEKVSIEIVSISIHENSRCFLICPDEKDCVFISKSLSIRRNTTFVCTSIVFVFENISNKSINIDKSDFKIKDSNGFVHEPVGLCDDYSKINKCNNHEIKVSPKTMCRFELYFEDLDGVCEFIYDYDNDDYDNEKGMSIVIQGREYTHDETYSVLIEKIELLKKQLSDCQNDNDDYSASKSEHERQNKIEYEVKEDDDYFYIIYQDEISTCSFNREFDKSKSNYNWINVNDPLITLRYDNVPVYMQERTIIQSPVCGIFEFDKNKLIEKGEVICRIRKYKPEEKNAVIESLQKEEIKESIYKKERKKLIERETLDELISEGKIFNYYTKKDGNRTTIPMDVASAVWNRDGGKCCICGNNENLEFDHIIPISKGGATTFRNLQLLCHTCNLRKSNNI